MTYSACDFMDDIFAELGCEYPPGDDDDALPQAAAGLALAEIHRLQNVARLAAPRPPVPSEKASAAARAGYRLVMVRLALGHMKQARDLLRLAGAGNAADYAARALKSAEGAERHATGLLGEAKRAEASAEAAARAAGWRRHTKAEKAAGFWGFQNPNSGTQSNVAGWSDLCSAEGIAPD